MKIMGLNSAINFIAWLISSLIPMIIVSLVVASKETSFGFYSVCISFHLVVLKYGGIFPASELSVTIATLLALALSALMLGFVEENKILPN